MNNKNNILFAIAILVVAGLFSIPAYNLWLTKRLRNDNFPVQLEHMSTEERMEGRFGNTYIVLRTIKESLLSTNDPNVLVLLPPQYYLTEKGSQTDFNVPEPAVFYYFTGFRAVTCTSPEAERARWLVFAQNNVLSMKHINTKQFRDSVLKVFRTYN